MKKKIPSGQNIVWSHLHIFRCEEGDHYVLVKEAFTSRRWGGGKNKTLVPMDTDDDALALGRGIFFLSVGHLRHTSGVEGFLYDVICNMNLQLLLGKLSKTIQDYPKTPGRK